ncbi:hypothetical protein Taro_017660 [Colocasia esculenta]|uniref:Transposase (putative) gypsy type domain-containing protein n=1 Tax=Colocasia esculenta TaxID=4460 RepID=A0A843UWR0_COLES|nr:hypothetical protein [Colocasia esculenta]
MPKSVRGLKGRRFSYVRVCSRERERTSVWHCTCIFYRPGCKLTCVTSADCAWKGTLKGVHNWRSYALGCPLGCQAVNAPLNSGARGPRRFGNRREDVIGCSEVFGGGHRAVMAQKGKEIVEASGMPPVKTKAVMLRSFEGLRERLRIGEEYDIVLMREDESYLTTRPGCFVLSLDLLEAGLRLPMPEIAKELLRSWKVAPIQLTPNSWRSIFVFCIICKKRGIEATAKIFRSHFQFGLLSAIWDGHHVREAPYKPDADQLFAPSVQQQGVDWTSFLRGAEKGGERPRVGLPR